MTDNTLILQGDDFEDQTDLEGDIDTDANDFEDEYVDDAAAPDKEQDGDFQLHSPNDFQLDEDDEDGVEQPIPEYGDVITGQKRKRSHIKSRSNSSSSSLLPDGDSTMNSGILILEESVNALPQQPVRASRTFGRCGRKKAEALSAHHRKVNAKPDSPDELMLDMREKGFSDRQIADKLAKDCHVNYDVKSISTRIMRVRLAQAENVDFLLREGYKEWQFKDDQLLLQAHALADIEVNYEIERIRAWRFRKVSEHMRRLNKDALFSATACRERYNAIMEGTARIPSEVDDDPEARRAEMEAHRVRCEKARLKEEAVNKTKAALQKRRKEEIVAQSAQKAEEVANKRAVKEAEKAQRAMQRAAKAQLRAQRAAEIQRAQQERNSQAKKQATFAEKNAANNMKTAAPKTKSTVSSNSDTRDPRSHLSLLKLRQLCAVRGLEVKGKTKDVLIEDIQDADAEWSLADLKKMCNLKGLGTTGTKATLRYRLASSSFRDLTSLESDVGTPQAEMNDESQQDEGEHYEEGHSDDMLLDDE